MIGILAAGALAPFFFEAAPEVRSTYVSLGKIVEDRPMYMTFVRLGCDAGAFGRFGVRHWDVSSLTDRRHDAHRHALYHTEFGPTWQYDLKFCDGWYLASDITRSWTLYRRFENAQSNRTYHWWQSDLALENPYVVPFVRLRRCFRGSDYFYFKAGVRRRFPLPCGLYVTPSVYTEGGSSRSNRRVLGARPGGGSWRSGPASASFRLELGWRFCEHVSAFAFAEQYEVVGSEARRANDEGGNRFARNDWTLGGFGMRFRF